MINSCPECFDKQRKIDELSEEVKRLKAKLNVQERKQEEGAFGSSTPSSKIPIKANTPAIEKKRPGAKAGHQGNGRKKFEKAEADQVIEVQVESERCQECGGLLDNKGMDERMVLDCHPIKPEKVLYRLPKRYCPHCRNTVRSAAPGVLPKSLFGNQLIANAVDAHYQHGLPLGRICEQIGIGAGSLVEIFHKLARLFRQAPDRLIDEYRRAAVKHADETSWRTNGKNGYVWLFATSNLSIFQFGKNRSAAVPKAIFGTEKLPGVLVVDRYNAYNKVPCEIQYCYAHLLRDVSDLEKDFPDDPEVRTFVATTAPLLSLAMGLRSQDITDAEFLEKAARLASDIMAVMENPARHLGIRHIQDIFRENQTRLYHWAKDRKVPADNNLAERDLRPSVIARKVSFGSVTDAGAQTRSILTTLVVTLKKRGYNVTAHLKWVLDQIAKNIHQDPFPLLFPKSVSP
ncbi:MAG: IS66 family transposase [Candidatus Schekmanbacteria bacterium]|nr:IS66 family transposase [Candidatus Schekmanbacteria bacterium]